LKPVAVLKSPVVVFKRAEAPVAVLLEVVVVVELGGVQLKAPPSNKTKPAATAARWAMLFTDTFL